MRPLCERDMVERMLEQLVQAFMSHDGERFVQAQRWLTVYADRQMTAKGWTRRGQIWQRPGSKLGGPRRRG